MLILIRNGEVCSPDLQGKKDVLLCAGKIARIADPGEIDPRGAGPMASSSRCSTP